MTHKALFVSSAIALISSACAHATRTPVHVHRSPPHSPAPQGEVVLERGELRIPFTCTKDIVEVYCEGTDCTSERRTNSSTCVGGELSVTLISPWGSASKSPIEADSTAQFAIDWAVSGVEPLAEDAGFRLSNGWQLAVDDVTVDWVPPQATLPLMIEAVAAAAGIDMTIAEETRPVDLEVTAVVETKLRMGAKASLLFTVRNNGPGVAYRAVVLTSSNVRSLHGLQVSFGLLQAGEAKTKQVDVVIPRDETDTEAKLTLTAQANQVPLRTTTQRFAIKPASMCPDGSITRDEYRRRHEALFEALKAGALAQDEFDAYDAELILCID
jgi:hypothetical protein